ncbi:shikimate kinase [Intestinibacter bartlettii]|uniref:Shikimate kinase n=2 Tax=Intestinibacter bartlettii TaxID=261299 RepID=A0ABS6DT46_9FIRM|nr:shikimate kinase [Intestinibacter bartlettii]MBU5334995.1 chorismate mutase [Intestinibacter bartlettii]
MDNIEKIRAKISMYDDEIIKILSKRMDCIDEIIEYKKENGMPILQPEYEGKKEIALCKKLKDNKYEDEIMNVFRYVVKNAKKYQAKNLFPYNIMLIGFMGSGKSTIAKYLSHILEMEDLETDEFIVKREDMTINEIFQRKGEEYFRQCENNALRELETRQGIIISCGGGMPMKDENVELMKRNGKIVLLTASPQTIYDRVKYSNQRPLLNGNMNVEYIESLMEKRKDRYESIADIVVDTNDKPIHVIAEEVVSKLATL